MSKDAEKDFSANPEIEQLLSVNSRDDMSNTHVRHVQPDEQLSMNELYLQGGDSSSLQDKSAALNHNVHIHIGESSSGSTAVITPSLIIASDNKNNDDPPPYTAIPPPYSVITPQEHIGWPYELFSFGDSYSTGEMTRRMQIPLTPFQACLTSATSFHPEGINSQYAPYSPLMSYRFFKCDRNSVVPREMTDDGIVEKIDDRKSRRCGALLVAAAVIIFLMALSLIVRFIMEKSLWRR